MASVIEAKSSSSTAPKAAVSSVPLSPEEEQTIQRVVTFEESSSDDVVDDHQPWAMMTSTSKIHRPIDLDEIVPAKLETSAFRQNSVHLAMDESQAYLGKIRALEAQLQSQQPTTQSLQQTDTTTYDALWKRNQSLVQEIRFADQTCLEVTHQNDTLQTQLHTQTQALQQLTIERDALQATIQTYQADAADNSQNDQTDALDAAQAQIASLESQLQVARRNQLPSARKQRATANIERIFQDAQDSFEPRRLQLLVPQQQQDLQLQVESQQDRIRHLEAQIEYERNLARDQVQKLTRAAHDNLQQVHRTVDGRITRMEQRVVQSDRALEFITDNMDPASDDDEEPSQQQHDTDDESQHSTTEEATSASVLLGSIHGEELDVSDWEGVDGVSVMSAEASQLAHRESFDQHLQFLASPLGILSRNVSTATSSSSGDVSDELQETKRQLAAAQAQLVTEQETTGLRLRELEASRNTLQELLQTANTDQDALRERIRVLTDETDLVLSDELQETKRQLAAAQAQLVTEQETTGLRLQELEASRNTLQELLQTANTDQDALRERIRVLTDEATALRRSMDLVTIEKEALQAKLGVRNKDFRDAQRSIAHYQAVSTTCKKKRGPKAMFKPWKKRPKELLIRSPIVLSPSKLKSPGSHESKDLLQKISSLQEQVDHLQTVHEDAKELAMQLAACKHALKAVTEERSDTEAQLRDAQSQVAAVSAELDHLRVSITDVEEGECFEDARQQVEGSASSVLDMVREKLQRKQAQMDEMESGLQNKLQNLQKEASASEVERDFMRAQHDAQLKELRQVIARMEHDYAELLQDYQSLEQRYQAAKRPTTTTTTTTAVVDTLPSSPNQQFSQALQRLESTKSDRDAVVVNLEHLVDRLARHNRVATVADQDLELVRHCLERMLAIEKELSEMEELLAHDRTRYEKLQTKCVRLKDYIRKLTKKCDEWEEFHQGERQVLHQLEEANRRTQQKASELAARYQQSNALLTTEKDRAHHERERLESELAEIARELSTVKIGKLLA